MKRSMYSFVIILLIIGITASLSFAQMEGLYGDDDEFRMGVHSGNQFRTTFYNEGTFGGQVNNPPEIAGEWPINSGHYYLVDGNIFVGSEVIDTTGRMRHILSENKSSNIGGSRGDQDPITGEWWTFLPLPGFANSSFDKIAMARGSKEWEQSWPAFWPDKFTALDDPGWRNDEVDGNPEKAAWNGYFGKNVFNADEESYFVADDYMNREFKFWPDSTNEDRKGLGIRMYVRGFQWSKSAVEDALFCLFDLENVGTHLHDKMVFGYKIGNNMGEDATGSDSGDDNASFNREANFSYMWDQDLGASGWQVGYMGGAFLESPGNPFDGIDNDNDGSLGSGPTITESMFNAKTLGLGDEIIIINYDTFRRVKTTLADTLADLGTDTLEIYYNSRVFKFWAGKEMEEIGDNLVDDNLNGIIDENRGVEIEEGVWTYLYIVDGQGYKYTDYFTGDGLDNKMMDERRDDGIDNDDDWDAEFDDTGADGLLPGTPGYPGADDGEGDGVPTSGEPHFDKTDINETDMLGLTSFNLYEWTDINQYDDEPYWNAMTPGYFSLNETGANVELLYASGYFPSAPKQIERFSVAIICGDDLPDILRNRNNVAQAYELNYNFAKAPNIPTVRAIPGDGRVTLFWDSYAEESVDPITGEDFEGYKIYRSTDPSFTDLKPITDGYGSVVWREPLVQYDLNNGVLGFSDSPTQGVQFWIGNDTGIRHYYVDTTVVNGYRYFYAVTSFDRGSADPTLPDTLGIDPSECSKFVAVQSNGDIEKGTNIAVVRPEARAAGYIPAGFENSEIVANANNTASGNISYQVLDPDQIKEGHTYEITFESSLTTVQPEDQPYARDSTSSFNLIDITQDLPPDTLFYHESLITGSTGLPIVDGFQLEFSDNPDRLKLNEDNSGWGSAPANIAGFEFIPYVFRTQPYRLICADFRIDFGDVGIDTSKSYYRGSRELPPTPVNFTITNVTTGEKVDFAFRAYADDDSTFSFNVDRNRSDEIIFLANPDSQIASWKVTYDALAATSVPAVAGTYLTLNLDKPFLPHDVFQFTTNQGQVDTKLAKANLDDIRVVPNPYIVTNTWEPENPYANGRGERQLHFTHLPAQCTIRIFNVRGQLVNTLHHPDNSKGNSSDDGDNSGTYIWDMLSKDNLDISYGIYIYHVEAKGVGEKVGKFAIIK